MTAGRSWLVKGAKSGLSWIVVYLPGAVENDWYAIPTYSPPKGLVVTQLQGLLDENPHRMAHELFEAVIRFDREMRAERDSHMFASAVVSDPNARRYLAKCGVMASNFAIRSLVTCAECLEAADAG